MALKQLPIIADRLLRAGRNGAEPVAVISRATTAQQRVLETSLEHCVADLAASGLEPPALVVIGEVVRLRGGLDWLGALDGRILDADPLKLQSKSETGS
jgi:uroporphyrin-III C-methyltransferase